MQGYNQRGKRCGPSSDTACTWIVQRTLERIQEQLHAFGVDDNTAGYSIILLTILTKVIAYPFTKTQVESAMDTQNLQPVIKAIKARYGDDKERVQAETARVFQDAGVNPLAGKHAPPNLILVESDQLTLHSHSPDSQGCGAATRSQGCKRKR